MMRISGPVRTTSHPANYPYSMRVSSIECYRVLEMGAWYTGESDGRFVAVADEGAIADLLDEPMDLVTIYEFASRSARDAWLAHRLPGARDR